MTEPNRPSFLIRIIDDDEELLEALKLLFLCADRSVRAYSSAVAFLREDDPTIPGCVFSDIRMPSMSGLELQEAMLANRSPLPLVFITGHGDIEMAVESMKQGAVDFLVKPVKKEKLFAALDRVEELLRQEASSKDSDLRERVAQLSLRERSVLKLLLQNVDTQGICERLGIGERTVQGHRWRVYQKLGINSPETLRQTIRPEWLR